MDFSSRTEPIVRSQSWLQSLQLRLWRTRPQEQTVPATRHFGWLMAGVLLLALSLRLWGISFGLPYVLLPVEPASLEIAQKIFKTSDPNPHYFNFSSVFYYLNALAYVPFYWMLKALGFLAYPADIPFRVMLDMGTGWTAMPSTLLLGRLLTVAFGIGAVWLTYLIGSRLTGRAAIGMLAATMVAVSP